MAEAKAKKDFIQQVKGHLTKEVSIPLGVLIVLLVVLMYPVSYQAKEVGIVLKTFNETQPKTVPGLPEEIRVCLENDAFVSISEHYVYKKPYGLNAYKCYAEFKVTNHEQEDGKWTYRYIFDVSGKRIVTNSTIKEIPKLAGVVFKFESDECREGDTVSGTWELMSGPKMQSCHYETVRQNKTIYEIVSVTKEEHEERIITKYEPIWQKIFGINRAQKV